MGWDVRERVVPGPWPRPDTAALSRLRRAVGGVPDGGLVLLDGLIASAAGPSWCRSPRDCSRWSWCTCRSAASPSTDAECAVLMNARAVVTTSAWTRRRLLERCRLPRNVCVARPGWTAARKRMARPPATGS